MLGGQKQRDSFIPAGSLGIHMDFLSCQNNHHGAVFQKNNQTCCFSGLKLFKTAAELYQTSTPGNFQEDSGCIHETGGTFPGTETCGVPVLVPLSGRPSAVAYKTLTSNRS